LIFIVCSLAVTIVLNINGFHISERLMKQVQEGISPFVYGGSAVVAARILYGIWRLTSRKLVGRDYYDYKAVS